MADQPTRAFRIADKRSVSTDALETLGKIIDENAGRDAIHLAVEPVVAAHTLRPGEEVGFVEGGVGVCDAPLGIVDPFLKQPVKPGERFWMILFPRTIQSLRHVWTHPAFPAEGAAAKNEAGALQKIESEAWLRAFCDSSDCPDYATVISAAVAHARGERENWGDDDYLHFSGRDAHGEIPQEFWQHLHVLTGVEIPSDKRASWFSCSC